MTRRPAKGAGKAGGRGESTVDDPPPLLASWRNVYLLLLAELAGLVLLFSLLTWWAS